MRFVNGNIITMRTPEERRAALRVEGEWLSDPDVPAARDEVSVDLAGRTVVPGFCDAHTHFHYWAATRAELELADADSLADVQARVAERAARTPPGTWIQGRGFDKNRWTPPVFPGREDLDRVAPEHPVALFSKDEHALWVNSRALDLARIGRETSDPHGGIIARDETGAPSGILFEKAYQPVFDVMPPSDPAADAAALTEAAAEAHARGVTAVHDMGDWRAWDAYLQWPEPTLDIVKYFPVDTADRLTRGGWASGDGSPALRIGGLKIYADGALGSQTAYMWEPFTGSDDNVGVARLTAGELAAHLEFAARHGFACAIHAIGDRANRLVIDAALECPAGALRHRIEHVQLLRAGDPELLARSGWVASVQPSHLVADRDTALRYWGAERSRYAYAFRSLEKAGVPLAFGSDAPIEPIDPLFGIYAACCRRHPEDGRGPWEPDECLDRYRTLHAFTVGAAYAAGQEAEVGTLCVGKRANFVVLDRDLLAVPEEDIPAVRVLATVVAGRAVWVDAERAPDLAETLLPASV